MNPTEPLQQSRASDRSALAAEQSRTGQAPNQAYPWPWTGYSDKPDEMPLSGYAALLAAYAAVFGPLWVVLWSRRRRTGADRPSIADAVLLGIATHKIGRIITKDWVTSPIRAPFTEYVESEGGGEVSERSRGQGLQRAVGDLLTCPWCIAPWVAGALYSAFLINPHAARMLAAGATSVAASDFLQHALNASKRLSK
jgi:hypothetical protein